MLMPKRVKYRKQQRGTRKGKAIAGAFLSFGDYGIQALESAWITARQIEACRLVITKALKKVGKMWIRIFPDKPVTKKPAESGMGKGKGTPEFWVSVVKRGRILFEIKGLGDTESKELLKKAARKLPIKTRVIKREEELVYEKL